MPAPGSYALPALGPAADGSVLASDGSGLRLHALLGDRVVLLSLIYTHCPDAEGCPLATAVLERVAARLGERPELAAQVRLVSLSFDPERDTPEVMREYARGFEREGVDWRFLSAESERALAPLLAAYAPTRVAEADAAGRATGDFSHLLRVFLIDRERRIRQVYGASLLRAEALLADLETLLLEERAAPGPSRPLAARRGRPSPLAERVARPPLGLPPVPLPADNPISAEKVALGRALFFDRRLSGNGTFSCAMCHVPEQGFSSNEMATAVGIEGRTVRRNAPTLYNVAYQERLFHDGRETRLEHQVWGPLLAPNEMGNASVGALLATIAGADDYAERFERAFPGRGLAIETVGMALASYERTLLSGDSAFDRHRYAGEDQALGALAKQGLALFTGKAGCAACHRLGESAALFSDGEFHNTGVGHAGRDGGAETLRVQAAPGVELEVPRAILAQVGERPPDDLGRYEVTGDPADRWKYRTPGLRNVALTAPYMHDGSLATLAEVVAFYDRGGEPNEGLDPRIRPLGLAPAERRALVAFLEALTGSDVEELVADAFAAPR